MKVFYKYTTKFEIEHFDNPTIKISNINFLNDPFESEAGDNLIEVLYSSIKKHNNKVKINDIKEFSNALIGLNGIFSVSETPRNPLMWAHYADQHRGLCIGYSEDLFSEMQRPTEGLQQSTEFKPVKVNYDNYRFDRQITVKYKQDINNAIKTHLLTKSDEWIYEKEHRCILPFTSATAFKISGHYRYIKANKSTEKITIDDYVSFLLEENKIEKIGQDTYKYINMSMPEIDILSGFDCVHFLYHINPLSIRCIYMGLRVEDDYIKSLYKHVKKEKSTLSHVKLFKFGLSTKRFEILPQEINENYISKIS